MPLVKCEGPDCPMCEKLGQPDRVRVVLEDLTVPKNSPDRFKPWSIKRSLYEQLKGFASKGKPGI